LSQVDYGQLSGLGASQCRDFGSYLRDRYVGKNKLLDENYNHYETHVRSTDVDRTLVSSMAVMAGLYPGRSIAPEFDGTVLVPIHTVPYATDALMDGSASRHCPKFNREAAAALNSKTVRDAILSDRKFTSSLALLSNVSEDGIRTMPGVVSSDQGSVPLWFIIEIIPNFLHRPHHLPHSPWFH